jgi:hypothetical protein
MTDEQQKLLTNFETRVRQLMLLCESLRQEKAGLEKALEMKNAALRKSEETVRDLKINYDNLKLAKMVSYKKSDVKDAQQKLSGLVREIDRCIALINE